VATEPPAWALSPLDHPPPRHAEDEDGMSVAGLSSVAVAAPAHASHVAHVTADTAEPETLAIPARAAAAARGPNPGSPAERELSRAFKLDDTALGEAGADGDEAELDTELEAFSGPSYKPLFTAALRALGAGFGALFGALGAASAEGSRAAMPKLRGA